MQFMLGNNVHMVVMLYVEFFIHLQVDQHHYQTVGVVRQMLIVMKVAGKAAPWFNQLCHVSYHLYYILRKQWKPRTKRNSTQADVLMLCA